MSSGIFIIELVLSCLMKLGYTNFQLNSFECSFVYTIYIYAIHF